MTQTGSFAIVQSDYTVLQWSFYFWDVIHCRKGNSTRVNIYPLLSPVDQLFYNLGFSLV